MMALSHQILPSGTDPNLQQRTPTLDRARAMAEAGFPVFPLMWNKRPLRGSRGHKDATRDVEKLGELFRHGGARSIGIPMGIPSGLMVVDVDPRNGGDVWETHALAAGLFAGALLVATPSGGRHYYFRYAPLTRCSNGRIALGVDVKTEGGYAIWYRLTPPSRVEFRDAPPALVDLIHAVRSRKPPVVMHASPGEHHADVVTDDHRVAAYIQRVIDGVRAAPDGTKHDVCLRAAYTLGTIGAGYGLDRARLAADILAALAGRDVKSWAAATRTIDDGLTKGWAAPSRLPDRAAHDRRDRAGPPRGTHRWVFSDDQHRDPPPGMRNGTGWTQYNMDRRSDCLLIIETEAAGRVLPDDARSCLLIQAYGALVAWCERWDLIVTAVQADLSPYFTPRVITDRTAPILAKIIERAQQVAQGAQDRRIKFTSKKLVELLHPPADLQRRLLHVIDRSECNRRRRERDRKAGRVARPHEVARIQRAEMGPRVVELRAQGRRWVDIAQHFGVSVTTVERAERGARRPFEPTDPVSVSRNELATRHVPSEIIQHGLSSPLLRAPARSMSYRREGSISRQRHRVGYPPMLGYACGRSEMNKVRT